jgi:hypothetical protein
MKEKQKKREKEKQKRGHEISFGIQTNIIIVANVKMQRVSFKW